ncbi:MAG: metal ABC transporter ATP-binding protein [candidate division WOR-3 bacterium]
MKAVSVSHLSVELGTTRVLSDINMEIEEGQIAGIIGPNGGGKTTLLRAILGIVKPSAGEIRVFGFEPRAAVKKALVGYLPQRQTRSLLPLTALEAVMIMGRVSKEKALRALELVGMAEHAGRSFWELSGGQAQRVSLARVIVQDPRLMLLDEPSTGIDTVSQKDFYRLLLRLRAESGTTVIMTSHDVGAISSYADQVFCLNIRLHAHGPASACFTSKHLSELYGREVDLIHHKEPDDRDT